MREDWEGTEDRDRTRLVIEHVKRNGAKGAILMGKLQKANVCKIMWIWNGVQYTSHS